MTGDRREQEVVAALADIARFHQNWDLPGFSALLPFRDVSLLTSKCESLNNQLDDVQEKM